MSQTAQIGAQETSGRLASRMRAGVYRGKGSVVVESVPIPQIREGEVCFAWPHAAFAGRISKRSTMALSRRRRFWGTSSGTIVKVGRGVEKFKAGDRVVAFTMFHAALASIVNGNSSHSVRVTRKWASRRASSPTAEASRNMCVRCRGLSNAA